LHNVTKKLINSVIKSGVFCLTIIFTLLTEPLWAGPPDGINVDEIQLKLNEHCFDAGPVDGIWGKKTEAAISSYFDAVGKKYSGVLTKQFLNEMNNGKTSNCQAGFSNAVIYYDDFSSKLNSKYMRNQIPECIGKCKN
jgi:peptidoglycan hydrolase-like protein with peptidoglycan-binding domain